MDVEARRRFIATRYIVSLLACLLISTCAPRPREISRIALLAPFEGRYREVGYNALYAAKLALQEWNTGTYLELLPVDDGGTPASAADRARALAGDPLVKAVVAIGYAVTDAETLRAFGDLPVIIAGYWGAQPETDTVFLLANPTLGDILTAPLRVAVVEAAGLDAPMVGGEVFALEQFPRLRPSVEGVRILSSAVLPDTTFTERYQQTGLYVPAPGLLASLTYDAFAWLLLAPQSSRLEITTRLSTQTYQGINGTIRFEAGYWDDAPVRVYKYDTACVQRGGEMCLVPADTATP